jgi:hypothetical protein
MTKKLASSSSLVRIYLTESIKVDKILYLASTLLSPPNFLTAPVLSAGFVDILDAGACGLLVGAIVATLGLGLVAAFP